MAKIRTVQSSRVDRHIVPSVVGAINRSKIFVPIFSRGYVFNQGCLQELAYVVEHKNEKQHILPLFYDIDPHDVRHQSGCYEKAFCQYKERGVSDEIIHNWKEALQLAGNLKGLALVNDANGNKERLQDLVLETVLKMQALSNKDDSTSTSGYKASVTVTNKLTGIDYQVDRVLKLLCTSTNDVKIVGLHGTPGIGKTTLAKVIYKKISGEFQCCSFLKDVRHFSQEYGLVHLQKQMLSQISKEKLSCDFLEEDNGIKMIGDTCGTKKILVILDDVSEKNQIDKLVGSVNWFGSGSRIIVTTRNIDVLNLSQAYKIYEVEELNPENSLQLFSKHAFEWGEPLQQKEIAEDIVSTTGGLPLALEVLGSYLHKKKHSEWLGTLRRLKEDPLPSKSLSLIACKGRLMESLKTKRSIRFAAEKTISKATNIEPHSSLGWDYDVFLSFRGLDTRDGFTDYLYEDLMQARIRTFRDAEKLQVGEDISPTLMKAISRSKIFIPIFSKGYASSEWCLQELAYVVEHEKQAILPVFFDVDPYEVRHHFGFYKKAFSQHKERGISAEVVNNWKEALQRVGKLKGLVLENDANGSKAKLKNLIVEVVSNLLKEPSVIITDKLIGIDYQIGELLNLLCTSMNDVRFVGIHGMGGIGKTTLAKFIYNKICDEFQCSSFLPDTQDLSQKYGLVHLQKQLISDILKGKLSCDFLREDDGIKMISDICCTKKILVILDDVGERKQIDKLAGNVDWFGPGSRIIITTRNIDVLNSTQTYESYEVKELSQDHSLQLLCRHAFGKEEPLENQEIARDIVSTAGGLPLALEVVGSYLHRKRHAEWLGTLKRLKEGPHDTVKQAFMISYDALSCEGKEIFCDIACFFIGCDRELVSYMWDSCNFCPDYEIDVLINKSLIKINQDNTLHMHDQLRDFGRKIVNQENISIPGNRSRLWNCEEAFSILTRNMVTKNVQALSLNIKLPSMFGAEAFADLSNLRFLKLSYACLDGDFQWLLPNLRWLSWHVCNPNIMPINLSLKELVILDLSKSEIAENWDGWSLIMEAWHLKVLKLTHCERLQRTPKFPKEATLEKLYLNRCSELCEIDPSIKNLKSLVLLDLRNSGLNELPQEIGSLTSLVELLLDDTRINALPKSIGVLTKLQKLSVIGCFALRELPTSIGELKSVKELVLKDAALQRLPDSIGNLYDLRVFDASHTGITALPDAIWRLESLEVFDVSNCFLLKGCVPHDLTMRSLRILRLKNTGIYSEPRRVCKLYRLQELDLRGSLVAVDLPLPCSLTKFMGNDFPFHVLQSLSDLWMPPAHTVEYFQQELFNFLSQLETLKLLRAKVKDFPVMIGDLPRLKYLSVSRCKELQCIPALPINLVRLKIKDCMSLENLCDLCNLKYLNSFSITGVRLETINGLRGLVSLCSLNVRKCGKLSTLDGIQHLTELKELRISECPSVRALPDLSSLRGPRSLDHAGCDMELRVIGPSVRLYK